VDGDDLSALAGFGGASPFDEEAQVAPAVEGHVLVAVPRDVDVVAGDLDVANVALRARDSPYGNLSFGDDDGLGGRCARTAVVSVSAGGRRDEYCTQVGSRGTHAFL